MGDSPRAHQRNSVSMYTFVSAVTPRRRITCDAKSGLVSVLGKRGADAVNDGRTSAYLTVPRSGLPALTGRVPASKRFTFTGFSAISKYGQC